MTEIDRQISSKQKYLYKSDFYRLFYILILPDSINQCRFQVIYSTLDRYYVVAIITNLGFVSLLQ